jgi:DNA-binding transcriptional ArsR family regulator
MRTLSAEESAYRFHETLLEVLKRLNQAEEERSPGVQGMELVEIERVMRLFWALHPGDDEEASAEAALRLLLENGLVRERDDPQYAWDRKRTLGTRYTITTLGKTYLVRQIQETERIR